MAEAKKSNLGRGLSALLGDEPEDYSAPDNRKGSLTVPVEFLHPGKYQPRQSMDEISIQELAQSIREKGILQPILVREHPDDPAAYEIIAGERRWRAAQLAALHEVPVIIKELSDLDALEVALVENLQRQDLSPLEEARGYKRLMEEFEHTQEALAEGVGKSRSHVANMMRLLALPTPIKDLLDNGALSVGHARALLAANDPVALARKVVAKGLNVRQTESLVKKQGETGKATITAGASKDADTLALERELTDIMGLRVAINDAAGKGSVTIHYKSLDQLDDVLGRLRQNTVSVSKPEVAVSPPTSPPIPKTAASPAPRPAVVRVKAEAKKNR